MLLRNTTERQYQDFWSESRAEPSVREQRVFCLWQAISQAMGLPAKPAGQGEERRSRPELRPGHQVAATEQQSTVGSVQLTRSEPTGGCLRLPRLRLEIVGTRSPQKRWLREPNLLRPRPIRRKLTTLRAAGEGGARGYRAHRGGAALRFPGRWAAKCRTTASILFGAAAGTRVPA